MSIVQKYLLKRSNSVIYLIFIFFLFLYLSFPTHNSTIDAYAYAVSVKYGISIFYPHHLLYNIPGSLMFNFLEFIGAPSDVLSLMKILNAFFAVFCLLLLKNIFFNLKIPVNKIIALLIFTGSSFGVMRYATENETYIIPIFFSLLGTLYFLKYINCSKNIYILISSLSGGIACLFHQLHFAWWLGLLITILIWNRNLKTLLIYCIPAIIVPIAYILVLVFYYSKDLTYYNLLDMFFEQLNKGNVTTKITKHNFIFTVISIIRTFFQVHGYMFVMIKKHLALFIPALVSLILIIIAFFKNRQHYSFNIQNRIVFNSHIIILVFHLLLAFYAIGNAEFMVMIPFLLAIILSCLHKIRSLALLLFSLAMLTWNFCYGIIPNRYYDFSGNSKLIDIIIKNPDKKFILREKVLIENIIFYQNGQYPGNIFSSPYYYSQKPDKGDLKEIIVYGQNEGIGFITDCVGNEEILSRAIILESKANKEFFKDYNLIPVDSFKSFTGITKLYTVLAN